MALRRLVISQAVGCDTHRTHKPLSVLLLARVRLFSEVSLLQVSYNPTGARALHHRDYTLIGLSITQPWPASLNEVAYILP